MGKVSIEPVSVAHAGDIFEGIRQGGLNGAVPGIEGIATLKDARAMLQGLAERGADGVERHFSVRLGESAKVVGMCALYEFGPDHSAKVGYWISMSQRRRGYGRAAVSALIDLAFNGLDLKKLYATSAPSNTASIALLRSLGFGKDPGTAKGNGEIVLSLKRPT